MSSGRNVQRWSDGRRLPNEEEFPSLPGSARPKASNGHTRPGSAQPSRPASQQQQQQQRPQRKTEHFPSLGLPSSSVSNMGPAAGPAPVYRNPTGYTPAWTAAGGGGAKPKATGGNVVGAVLNSKKVAPAPMLDDEDPPLPKPAVPMEPKMTRLKKQDRNEQQQQSQQLEIAEDFPDLAAKAEKPKDAKSKGKKKKNKGIGSLLSDLSPAEPARAPSGVADSLAAAAALISIDDPRDTIGNSATTSDKNEGGIGGGWSKVPAKEKSLPPPKSATKLAANGEVSTAIPGLAFEMSDQSKSRPTSSPSSSSSSHGGHSKPTPHAAAAAAAAAHSRDREDFPSLGPSSKPMSANFRSFTPSASTSARDREGQSGRGQAPSSTKAPPPGFGGAKKSKAPPPGFGGATAASRGSSSTHRYSQPGSFNQRNVDLASVHTYKSHSYRIRT